MLLLNNLYVYNVTYEIEYRAWLIKTYEPLKKNIEKTILAIKLIYNYFQDR